jgi:IS605 OrfB family transposase
VLEDKIAKRCEQILRKVAVKYKAEIIALEIMPDHIHLLVEVDPQFGIHRLVKNLKGVSSHGGMLAKSVHDVGWSSFIANLSYKAANAGRTLIAIDPRGTSQTCLCGATVRKLLSNRAHVYTECGLIAPRDVVSAQVTLHRALGLSVDALTECSNAA